ncbi:hypothetical protein UFOVP78_34 [uncultured Caudovirales phage]|uniref:Rap1a immunity protein domain-containing protein n=1 Tax=uncultured Caudovirales phage TaxID=2100421 RepID=A0A6J5KWX0_9CAUD|nr:hypothetical protein UFOVP78_34 [uncultured Caudovirales phage]
MWGDDMLRTAALLTLALLTGGAKAQTMATQDIVAACNANSPVCTSYLRGAYDGIIQGGRNAGATRLICAPADPNGAQLRQYFLVAAEMGGPQYARAPAAVTAATAFMLAMPCR